MDAKLQTIIGIAGALTLNNGSVVYNKANKT